MPDKLAKMSQPQDWKLIVEKDVPIKLRDGAVIYCDVLRPDCKEKVPALMNIGPYQKDKLWRPPADLEEKANPYLNWETANPGAENTIYSGGDKPSYLLLPVIPAKA